MGFVIKAVVAFVSTNIDNLVFITALAALCTLKRQVVRIAGAQYLSLVLLVGMSMAGAWAAVLVAQKYIRLLGLIPLLIGVKGLFDLRKDGGDEKTDAIPGLWAMTLLAISSGMDNVSVYVPMFADMHGGEYAVLFIVFAVMPVLWMALGWAIARMKAVRNALSRHASVIIPCVFVLLGLYILLA